MMTGTPKVVLDRVSKSFSGRSGSVAALAEFSLDVAANTFVSVLGPSGCGKTTVLRLIDGLVPPDTGSVRVDGEAPRPGPKASFVFQSFRLAPWLTVSGNIGLPLEIQGMAAEARRERIARYLALVGLERFADSYPNELSGGMKQRVALARGLAAEPDILLMDEPFASIDAQTRELMQIELMRIWTARKSLVVFVTHSVDEAVLLGDKVVLMSPRPGRVLEVLDVPLPRPRWQYDARAEPEFVRLRSYLWERISSMVLADRDSDFFGRDLGGTTAGARG
ncbi:ABC transporter ATP-binding protein [soil metagenome]